MKNNVVNNKYNLTVREFEVLELMLKTYSNFQIAEELCISTHTAKAHVCSILHKMNVEDRLQAVLKTLKENLVEQ